MHVFLVYALRKSGPLCMPRQADARLYILNMQPTVIKGMVLPIISFLSLFTHSHVVPNLYSFLSCAEQRYFEE